MSRRNKAAALAREVQRRQQPPQQVKLTLVPAPPQPWGTDEELQAAMAPLPDEFVWKPWGYLLPEVSRLVDEPTRFLPVIDFVRDHSFAELLEQVA